MEPTEFLTQGFIQRALIAGFFIALLCSILGVFLVLRNLSLIGDGLSHVTFGSVALGMLLKVYPLYIALPIVMISAIGIMKIKEKARLLSDAAIGIVSSSGIAIGVFISSIAGGFNIDLFSYLFGNILSINWTEVFISIFLSIALVLLICIFYHELLFITFDEESAKVSGINVRRMNMLLYIITALTVVLAMKAVGILLVTALIILPPVTALQLSKGFRNTLIASSIIGVFSVILGIVISFFMDFPPGATIVLLNSIFFLFSLFLKNYILRF